MQSEEASDNRYTFNAPTSAVVDGNDSLKPIKNLVKK